MNDNFLDLGSTDAFNHFSEDNFSGQQGQALTDESFDAGTDSTLQALGTDSNEGLASESLGTVKTATIEVSNPAGMEEFDPFNDFEEEAF